MNYVKLILIIVSIAISTTIVVAETISKETDTSFRVTREETFVIDLEQQKERCIALEDAVLRATSELQRCNDIVAEAKESGVKDADDVAREVIR